MINNKTKFKETEIGLIPEEWSVKKLSSLAGFKYGLGESAKNIGDYVYIRITDITNDGFLKKENLMFLSRDKVDCAYVLNKGDVLVARTGASFGKTYFFNEDFEATYGGFLIKYIFNKEFLDNKFFFQFSRSSFFWNQANSLVGGGAQPQFNANTLGNLLVPCPSLAEQQKIAEILSSLDDKIQLNRKINDNLEKIASTLFKRWFVDFEFPNKDGKPYKSSGGKMIDSELGEIPDGWEALRIDKVASIEYGRGEYSKISSGKYSVFGAGGLVGYSDDYEYENQQLIIGCRGTCGNLSITDKYVTITHNLLIIKPKDNSNFNIYSLKKGLEFSEIKSVITGSTQPQITIKDLSSLLVLKSEKNIIDKYNNFVVDFEEYILEKKNEIKILELVRDSLLPKLMSGKIRVKI